MFSISAKLEGDWDIDGVEFEVECPRCGFLNPLWLNQTHPCRQMNFAAD